jgi:hypothetical protein
MTAFAPRRSTFDRFLFAIVLESDGLPLTVLTMLTRLDLDPWQEAARLSELPRAEAINSFAATIWRSQSRFVTADAANNLASGLIDLLPSREQLVAQAMAVETAELSTIWIISAVFFGMMAVTERQAPRPEAKDLAVQSVEMKQAATPSPFPVRQQRE